MRSVAIETSVGTRLMTVPDAPSWDAVARQVLPDLHPGTLLALSGPLGAGKTTFVQALARTLGIEHATPSPTFSLLRSYRLPKSVNHLKRLIHVDAYRIEQEVELLPLDLESELSDGESLLVLEWPEKVPSFVASHPRRVTIRIT